MKKYNIYPYKTDLYFTDSDLKNIKDSNSNITVINSTSNDYVYKTIIFNSLHNQDNIKKALVKELIYYFKKVSIKNSNHFLIVGLGNDNYTADSIGPKTLKHIKVNSYLENFNIKIKGPIISALEPGVLGETGILTEKIISSVIKEIKPDILILIDSYITDDIAYLNKTLQITDKGLYPGCGIKKINSRLDKEVLGIPVIVIGVPTAVEVKFSREDNTNCIPYILSIKDVERYVNDISKIIGEAINTAIDLLEYQDNND